MAKENITTLKEKYSSAENADNKVFKEMRSNIRLVIGEHYLKNTEKSIQNVRALSNKDNRYKLRLTKNHIQAITKLILNNINRISPGVAIVPNNDAELQDQKAAELYDKTWKFIKNTHNLKDKVRKFIKNFVEIGEAHVKITWDANSGKPINGELQQILDPDTGEVIQQIQEIIIPGDLKFENIEGFNLLRDPAAKNFDECRWLCIRKLLDKKELIMKYEGSEKQQFITEDGGDTYNVFDSNTGLYKNNNPRKILIREFYFKPSKVYPKGYYYITTDLGILEEGELPLGVFPIVSVGYDEATGSPRAYSIIKQLRPYQAEINRTASKIAEHQVTLGDDTVYIQKGTRIAPGGTTNGVKAVQYSGQPPIVQPGRNGAQYLEYMQSQITEMYKISNVHEMEEAGQSDTWAMLFRSFKDQQRFSYYGEKIEGFLKEICELSLRLFKEFAHPQTILKAIGRNEQVNIKEFKSNEDLDFQINLEARTDDIESQFGKQLSLNQLLQYSSGNMTEDLHSQIIRNLPFANLEEIVSDTTINYDNAKNMMLALERGEAAPIGSKDDYTYMIRRLTHRMRQPEFKVLSPEIQDMYNQTVMAYEELLAEQIKQQQALDDGFIPTGGDLVSLNIYETVPSSSGGTKQEKAKIPMETWFWLKEKLKQQGFTQENLNKVQQAAQADIAGMVSGVPDAGTDIPGSGFNKF